MAKVGIDIGHGVNTYPPSKGVTVNGVQYAEHTFNAEVGMLLDKHLKRNGIQTFMKQQPYGQDVGLTARTSYFNSIGVDMVWSIHANAGAPTAKGIGTFYWHNSASGKRLAQLYAEEIKNAGLNAWGGGIIASVPNTWTDFHMVRETNMVAVLTENGFMTNAEDFKNIFQNRGYVEKIAESSARAICRYFGITYQPEAKPQPEPQPDPVEIAKAEGDRKLELNERQLEEMARVYQLAFEKGIFSSNVHAEKLTGNQMSVDESIYLITALTGAILNGGKRV